MPIAILALAALAQAAAVTGSYAERAPDGAADCGNPDANRLELHVLDAPPHHRSPNVGVVSYRIGDVRAGFTLTARPVPQAADGDGGREVEFSGGRLNTAGLDVDGVSSGQLRGRFEGRARLTASGDLAIRDLRYGGGRWSDPLEIHVEDGRLPGGRALRAFSRCAEEEGG